MIKIDLFKIKDWLVKYGQIILILVLCVVIFKQCEGSKELALANSSLKKDVKEYVSNAKQLVDKNNVLEEEKFKYIEVIVELKKKVVVKEIQVADLNKKVAQKVSDVKLMKSDEIANYYKDRYKMPSEVKKTNLGTAITDTVAKLNITELVRYDGVKAELKITKEVLSLEKNISTQKDSIIENVETQNTNLELAVKENEKAINSQSEIIDNTEKMFKKERNKKNAWKLITAGVVGVSGYLLIAK